MSQEFKSLEEMAAATKAANEKLAAQIKAGNAPTPTKETK